MTTKITEQNISELANAGVNWQSVFTGDGSTGLTIVAGRGYFIDTTSGTVTVTLPASPNIGDTISIRDYAGTFGTNKVTISRNGQNLGGNALDGELTINNTQITFVYVDSTQGWLSIENEAKTTPLIATFTTATGGTITTSGDFKIHTFTGDGCFVVSCVGNSPANPSGGPAVVDYLVVAGGGGGGQDNAGGGGGGGFRESHSAPVSGCYTASPLATPTGITVSATTYPITVGAGGTYTPPGSSGTNGSPSVFSTITSAGGGFGSGQEVDGGPGGSGGGAGSRNRTGGAGNTPPVSPPQGNSGGNTPGSSGGAGGGGAGAAAPNNTGTPGTPGGAGAGTLINPATGETGPGPSQYYSGGGGGGGGQPGAAPGGSGGVGGGGDGGLGTNPGCAATANTGGGGGGGGQASPGNGAAGGKGIVIIRYKYQ